MFYEPTCLGATTSTQNPSLGAMGRARALREQISGYQGQTSPHWWFCCSCQLFSGLFNSCEKTNKQKTPDEPSSYNLFALLFRFTWQVAIIIRLLGKVCYILRMVDRGPCQLSICTQQILYFAINKLQHILLLVTNAKEHEDYINSRLNLFLAHAIVQGCSIQGKDYMYLPDAKVMGGSSSMVSLSSVPRGGAKATRSS